MLRVISKQLHKLGFPVVRDEHDEPKVFYHGTDKKFDKFERRPGKRYVLWSEFPVNSPGHFFTPDPEFAQEFGSNVMKRHLDINKILLDPKEYPHMGVDSFPPEFEDELRYILEPMIEKSPEGDRYVDVGVGRFYIKDDDWIYNLVTSNGMKWDALDNEGVVKRMKERGYDATYVDEAEGQHSIFVVDSGQILHIS